MAGTTLRGRNRGGFMENNITDILDKILKYGPLVVTYSWNMGLVQIRQTA